MTRKVPALVVAAMLVLTAFASVPVAAAESVAVETDAPTDVTTDSATLNGEVTALENASEATVWFEYWVQGDSANATTSPTLTVSGNTTFSIDVLDLQPNTTYVVVAHAETQNASGVGSEVTFTTDAVEAVAVETGEVSDVTDSSATLTGELTALEGAENATVWFEYWVQGDPANETITATQTLGSTGTFTAAVDGLANDTTYVVVAHADIDNASAVGDEVTFTTDGEETVVVETGDATDVTDTSATLTGELTTLEGAENATVWFEYWVEGDSANATTTPNQTLDDIGSFSAAVDGLANGTTYVFVAHAETDNASDSGAAVEFTTFNRAAPLDVDTLPASEVDNTSATLNGQLTGMDGEDEATVWFEYWVEGDRTNASTTANQTLDDVGSFSAAVSGLENDTTYVYVAHAASNGSTVTGDEVEFTTGADGDEAVDRTWDGEGPFGQWLTSILRNLVPADGVPFGQLVSEIVTANNPGSEHRSEHANPGGNGSGPPEHAGNDDDEDESDDEDDRGPPAHAGKDDDDDERGPPDHAKGGEDEENESDDDDSLDVSVDGDVSAGANVTVTVTADGEPVENATVTVEDEVVGTTNADGQLEVTLPDDLGDELTISVESEDAEGEWEHELEEDDG